MNLPINKVAEMGVIGACMDGAVLGGIEVAIQAAELLPARCFYHDDCRFVFERIVDGAQRGRVPDMWHIRTEWQAAFPALTFDMEFFSVQDLHPRWSLHNRAETVLDLYKRRQAMIAAHGLLSGAESLDAPLADTISTFDETIGLSHTNAPPILDGKRLAQELNSDLERRFDLKGALSGIDTGLWGLNKITDGLQAGEVWIIGARPSVGKAQPLHSKILTPNGWKTMGEMKEGDFVIGADGKPKLVRGVFPQGVKPVLRFTTTDGASAECCEEHLWLTSSRSERKAGFPASVKQASEIAKTLKSLGRNSHALPYCEPVEFVPTKTTIDPWLLGVWIGDGSGNGNAMIHNPEPDIIERIKAALPESDIATIYVGDEKHSCPQIRIKRKQRNNECSDLMAYLRSVGLGEATSFTKFIPTEYLLGNRATRLELLRGLIDSDGYVFGKRGHIEVSTASDRLSGEIIHLVQSLGGRASVRMKENHYVLGGFRHEAADSWRIVISFTNGIVPVSSRKHLAKYRPLNRRTWRFINSCQKAGESECQCISVDGGLYITDGFLITHNTGLALNIADHVAINQGIPCLFVSLEMSALALSRRLLSMRGEINGRSIRSGTFTASEFKSMAVFHGKLKDAPLYIMDSPGGVRINQLCHSIRAAVKRWGVRVVFIDYLQKIRPEAKGEKRTYEIGDTSSQLVELTKREKINLFALAQLNRENEKDKGRPPRLSDLADSKSIEADADFVGLLDRPINGDEGQAVLRVAKQRDGERGSIPLIFQGWHCRFKMGTTQQA